MGKNPSSEGSLDLHGTPELGSRFGRRAAILVSSVVFFAFAVIVFGIFTRGSHSRWFGNKDDRPPIASAADVGKSMVDAAPSGTLGMQGLLNALTAEREARAKAEAEAAAARNKPVPASAPGRSDASPADSAAEASKRSAMSADTGGGTFGGAGRLPGQEGDGPGAKTLAPDLSAQMPASVLPGVPGSEEDQNRQVAKVAFLERAAGKSGDDALEGTRKLAISAYEIKASTVIPAVMLTGVNSDLPGHVIGQVSENVYDTASGHHLLIPQGTRLFGSYDSGISYGQERALVVWDRLIFPDGSSIRLQGMGGSDKSGYAGFADQVNNHYLRLIGMAALTTAFAVAFQQTQNGQGTSIFQTPTASATASAEVSRQVMDLGTRITKKNLNIQPTIEIRPGYRFNVLVNKDMIFKQAYTDLTARH